METDQYLDALQCKCRGTLGRRVVLDPKVGTWASPVGAVPLYDSVLRSGMEPHSSCLRWESPSSQRTASRTCLGSVSRCCLLSFQSLKVYEDRTFPLLPPSGRQDYS